jgi:hypothetical protein
MASVYPTGLDTFSTTHIPGEAILAATDNDMADAINKIEAELGITPSDSYATVKARLDALATLLNSINTELGTDPSGSYDTVKARIDALAAIGITGGLNGQVWSWSAGAAGWAYPGTLGVTPVTANYTLASTDDVIRADSTAAAVTVSLPTAVGVPGKVYVVKRVNSGANNVVLSALSAGGGSPTYSATILAETALQSFWRFEEASGAPADSEGAVAGTITGSPTQGVTGLVAGQPTAKAIQVTASGQSVAFGDNYRFSGTSSFTVESWLKPSLLDTHRSVLAKHSGTDGWNVWIHSTLLGLDRVASSVSRGTNVAHGLAVDATAHVAWSYDGSTQTYRIYVNGARLVQTTEPSLSIAGSTTALTLASGALGGFSSYRGVIDELAVYNATLDDATILAHYNARNNTGGAAETIDGAASKTLAAQWDSIAVMSDGTNWLVV